MRQSKFTDSQIVSILKEANAGRPINEIWRTYRLSRAKYYRPLMDWALIGRLRPAGQGPPGPTP